MRRSRHWLKLIALALLALPASCRDSTPPPLLNTVDAVTSAGVNLTARIDRVAGEVVIVMHNPGTEVKNVEAECGFIIVVFPGERDTDPLWDGRVKPCPVLPLNDRLPTVQPGQTRELRIPSPDAKLTGYIMQAAQYNVLVFVAMEDVVAWLRPSIPAP